MENPDIELHPCKGSAQRLAAFFVSLPQIDSDVIQSLPPIYLAGRYDLSCRTHHLCRNQPPVAA